MLTLLCEGRESDISVYSVLFGDPSGCIEVVRECVFMRCMVGVLRCVEDTLRGYIMVYWEGMLESIEEVVEGVWWVYWGVLRIHWGDALWCIERVCWSVLRRLLRVYWGVLRIHWGDALWCIERACWSLLRRLLRVYGGCIELCWEYTEEMYYGVLRGYVGVYWGCWGCMVSVLRCVEDTLRRCIMVYWEGTLECIEEVFEGLLMRCARVLRSWVCVEGVHEGCMRGCAWGGYRCGHGGGAWEVYKEGAEEVHKGVIKEVLREVLRRCKMGVLRRYMWGVLRSWGVHWGAWGGNEEVH